MGQGVIMANMGTLLSFVFLAAILTVGYTFQTHSLGAADAGVNLSGSSYQQAYNASVQTSLVAVKFQSYIPILLGFIAIVVALLILVGLIKVKFR